MIDLTIVGVVVFAVIVLYVVERYTRQKSVDVGDALKLGTLSGALTGGVLYAIGGDGSVASAVASVTETAQDMFVGKPSF